MNLFKKLSIRLRYYKLLRRIPDMGIYDGRGRGIDVYICEKCGEIILTRYADKGVTPFVMRCRCCGGDAIHKTTVSDLEGNILARNGIAIQNWVRPPLDALWEENNGFIEHVLNGGLVLESEIMRAHYYDGSGNLAMRINRFLPLYWPHRSGCRNINKYKWYLAVWNCGDAKYNRDFWLTLRDIRITVRKEGNVKLVLKKGAV